MTVGLDRKHCAKCAVVDWRLGVAALLARNHDGFVKRNNLNVRVVEPGDQVVHDYND